MKLPLNLCPWCNREPEIRAYEVGRHNDHFNVNVACPAWNCARGIDTFIARERWCHETKGKAALSWNTDNIRLPKSIDFPSQTALLELTPVQRFIDKTTGSASIWVRGNAIAGDLARMVARQMKCVLTTEAQKLIETMHKEPIEGSDIYGYDIGLSLVSLNAHASGRLRKITRHGQDLVFDFDLSRYSNFRSSETKADTAWVRRQNANG